jgi:uncharacterized membrane protein YoaK (UPF0700 family)
MSSGTATDTWHFFARPWLAALALAWTVGVIDAYSFDEYGVFTSNQAGNLVVLGTELPQDPQRATLAGLSLLGAVVGVAGATVLQRLFATRSWLQVAVPLVFMLLLMVVAWFLRHVVESPPSVLVPVTSAALAGLATAVYRTPAIQGWITANTGAVLTTVHVAFETAEERRQSRRPVQPAIMITLGFLSGALLWGSGIFGTSDPTPVALIPTVIALALAVLNARRSGDRLRSGRSSLGA